MSDTLFFWLLMLGILLAPFIILAVLSIFTHISVNTPTVDYMIFTYIFDYIKLKSIPHKTPPAEKPLACFRKNFTSLFYILLSFLVPFGAIILLSSSRDNMAKALFLLIAGIYIVSFIILPQEVQIFEKGFAVNHRFFDWESVEKVDFVLPKWHLRGFDINDDLSFSTQTIRIKLKNLGSPIGIFPRLYKDNKKLRTMFEAFASELGLKGKVTDLGL